MRRAPNATGGPAALALLVATGAGVRAALRRRRAQPGAAPTDGAPADSSAPQSAGPAPPAPSPGSPTLVTQPSPGTIAAEQEAHGAAGPGGPVTPSAGPGGGAPPGGAGDAGAAPDRGPA